MAMTNKTRCPLCHSPAGSPAFPYELRWEGETYMFVSCTGCNTAFLDPVPSEAVLASLYTSENYHSVHYSEAEESLETRLPQIASKLPNRATLLDFGCGTGGFLQLAIQLGFDATGVELDPATRLIASQRSGCRVEEMETLIAMNARFDLIHLGDVLEHLPNPSQTLAGLRQSLAPAGCFFIEGPLERNPSLVRFASELFGAAKRLSGRAPSECAPFHLFRTDAASQFRFFVKNGYEIEWLSVWETGWPYLCEGDRQMTIAQTVRSWIGRLAIPFASVAGRLSVQAGNRFAAIIRPIDPQQTGVS